MSPLGLVCAQPGALNGPEEQLLCTWKLHEGSHSKDNQRWQPAADGMARDSIGSGLFTGQGPSKSTGTNVPDSETMTATIPVRLPSFRPSFKTQSRIGLTLMSSARYTPPFPR